MRFFPSTSTSVINADYMHFFLIVLSEKQKKKTHCSPLPHISHSTQILTIASTTNQVSTGSRRHTIHRCSVRAGNRRCCTNGSASRYVNANLNFPMCADKDDLWNL